MASIRKINPLEFNALRFENFMGANHHLISIKDDHFAVKNTPWFKVVNFIREKYEKEYWAKVMPLSWV